jgi:cell wall-associated NlpC family hydrolase
MKYDFNSMLSIFNYYYEILFKIVVGNMNILKKVLSLIAIVELITVITIFTQRSLEKVNGINDSYNLFSIKQKYYQKDITLKKIIEDEKMIRDVVASFDYKKYKQSRYQPIEWIFKSNLSMYRKDKDIEYKAKRLLGKRYVWGATGPNCFDCSGFTQRVYRTVGIYLPRVSRSQAKIGKLVRFDELQRGDMVFFDTSKKNQGRVNHVGIYLEDGKFIHASSGNHKVVITSFNKKRFYKNRFLWGRRILKNINYHKL